MTVFDKKTQKVKLWCHICGENTDHKRTDQVALFTCSGPNHAHPTRAAQEAGYTEPEMKLSDMLIRNAQVDELRKAGIEI